MEEPLLIVADKICRVLVRAGERGLKFFFIDGM